MKLFRDLTLLLAFAFPVCTLAAQKWPLEYQGKSTNNFIWDKRTVKLVESTIPKKLANDLLDGLGGPPDPVHTTAGRFFSASACVAHACDTKSFYWYDTQTGSALGAILEAWENEPKLTLTSRKFQPNTIPAAALSALKEWLSDLELRPTSVTFSNMRGRKVVLSATKFQPRVEFIPPLDGPSFDCTLSSTAVEREVCKSPDLSMLDLELSKLVRDIRNGSSTVPAREQLKGFQQLWLRTRDLSCEHSRAIHDCLVNSYREQHHALMNWIPARSGT